METIPTAEKFINRGLDDSGFELSGAQLKIISRNVIEFAKLHVTEALRQAAETSNGFTEHCPDFAILENAYSLDNIK